MKLSRLAFIFLCLVQTACVIGEDSQAMNETAQIAANQPRTIKISSIEGITTQQVDWQALIKDLKVKPDPLAAYIPADQHAIFYPTFKSMMDLVDEIKAGRQTLEIVGFSTERLEFYEQQMCVWLDGWSRFWGPKTIRGVAITGGDPYMTKGTDSAILFDASIGKLVFKNTQSKQEKQLKTIKGSRFVKGSIEGIAYRAVVSPDRRLCSYLAKIKNVVVVTNSLAQMERIVKTALKKQPCMAACDEYKFFRNRYSVDENKQTALVVLTDAAIRRWCSPKWRIGEARRGFASSMMTFMQAARINQANKFNLADAQKFLDERVADIGIVSLTEAGVTSSVYGNIGFMTPINELAIEEISENEKQQYEQFKSTYQRQLRNFFDPVAICFLHEKNKTNADLTIRPLFAESKYGEWIQFAGKNTIRAGDGDPHPESIAQIVFAIDNDSEAVRRAGQFVNTTVPLEGQVNAFSWLGRWVTVYADESPFWEELSKHLNKSDKEVSDFLEANLNSVPVAIAADVENHLELTAFLNSLKAYVQQTAPGMTLWENLVYKDRPYVKVNISYNKEVKQQAALYYAILDNQLLISPNEDIVQRAFDRNTFGKKIAKAWAGRNISAEINEDGWRVFELLKSKTCMDWLQRKLPSNLPVLSKWHPPADNPKEWQNRLAILANIKEADVGITFEEDGLRLVIKIDRKTKER